GGAEPSAPPPIWANRACFAARYSAFSVSGGRPATICASWFGSVGRPPLASAGGEEPSVGGALPSALASGAGGGGGASPLPSAGGEEPSVGGALPSSEVSSAGGADSSFALESFCCSFFRTGTSSCST